MLENKFRSTLCCIADDIADFEFKTPEALQLKQEIRRWYYGGRDGGEARELLEKFNGLFSSNVILDTVEDFFWTIAEQSPLEISSSLRMALSAIPRGQVVGRSIRAYEITAVRTEHQFTKWKNDAEIRITAVLNKIDEDLKLERIWYASNQVSLPSALTALAGIAMLTWGLFFLLMFAKELVQGRSFYGTVSLLPSYRCFDPRITLVCLGVFLLTVVILLVHLPQMVMTLCAGLIWTFYQKGRFKRRAKLIARFRQAMQKEGLSGYCDKLRTAAQQLADLPPDAPQNRDPSRALLGRAGQDKVFQTFSVRPISRCWSAKKFFKKVENCHVRSRKRIVILSVTLVALGLFLLQAGIILDFMRELL